MTTTFKSHGNLSAYRIYLRPMAKQKYGNSTVKNLKLHQKNVLNILRILFTHGSGTTWDMAKTHMGNVENIRTQEKIFRRLLVGRRDRNVYSDGLVNTGLVITEKDPIKPYMRYRLSLHGILYSIDAFDPSQQSIDRMVTKYAHILPRVFGKWKMLKEILNEDVYSLKILAAGLSLHNIHLANMRNPVYELMLYLHIKYRRNFEIMYEHDLADQISYWFYTFLMYKNIDNLKTVLAYDDDIRDWYMEFISQAKIYYDARLLAMQNVGHVLGAHIPNVDDV